MWCVENSGRLRRVHIPTATVKTIDLSALLLSTTSAPVSAAADPLQFMRRLCWDRDPSIAPDSALYITVRDGLIRYNIASNQIECYWLDDALRFPFGVACVSGTGMVLVGSEHVYSFHRPSKTLKQLTSRSPVTEEDFAGGERSASEVHGVHSVRSILVIDQLRVAFVTGLYTAQSQVMQITVSSECWPLQRCAFACCDTFLNKRFFVENLTAAFVAALAAAAHELELAVASETEQFGGVVPGGGRGGC